MDAGRCQSLVDEQIIGFSRRPDSSARVLLVSVFGDSIAPRTSSVWLTSLAGVLAPFGISDRLVRTSVQRLVGEGLLDRQSRGRRSFYSISATAQVVFDRAEQRIYRRTQPQWDGRWTAVLVPTDTVDLQTRARLRDRLRWVGFDAALPGLFVSPSTGLEEARAVVHSLDLAGQVAALEMTTDAGDTSSGPLLTKQSGALLAAADRYHAFLRRYAAIAEELAQSEATLSDEQKFCLRTLVVHDYRRAVLADPGLPEPLLPDGWPGREAFGIAGTIYRPIAAGADRHVGERCVGINGPLDEPAGFVEQRFAQES